MHLHRTVLADLQGRLEAAESSRDFWQQEAERLQEALDARPAQARPAWAPPSSSGSTTLDQLIAAKEIDLADKEMRLESAQRDLRRSAPAALLRPTGIIAVNYRVVPCRLHLQLARRARELRAMSEQLNRTALGIESGATELDAREAQLRDSIANFHRLADELVSQNASRESSRLDALRARDVRPRIFSRPCLALYCVIPAESQDDAWSIHDRRQWQRVQRRGRRERMQCHIMRRRRGGCRSS